MNDSTLMSDILTWMLIGLSVQVFDMIFMKPLAVRWYKRNGNSVQAEQLQRMVDVFWNRGEITNQTRFMFMTMILACTLVWPIEVLTWAMQVFHYVTEDANG